MTRWLVLYVLGLALLGGWMRTSDAHRRALIRRELAETIDGVGRFVDAGVVLHVVAADPKGSELLEGKPLVRIVRTHRFGGVIDTRAVPPRLCGPSHDPVVWYCSEDQEPVILHRDSDPLGQLVYGSEGAGKTVASAMWHALRWLEHLGEGREGGQTAPIADRLDLVRAEMMRLWRPTWYRYRVADQIFEMCDGSRIRLVATYQQSRAAGSPIQGFNWSWCARDEGQDQVERHEDIESRGRSAKHGRYKQLITATAKDSSDWRDLRDRLEAAKDGTGKPLWVRRSLLIARSPFVAPGFLESKRATVSDREFQRRYLAIDLPPERSTYPAWRRERNLVTIPDLGWEDVTAALLQPWAPPGITLAALAGHDPGALFDVTVLLKAYRTGPRQPHFWVVIGEVTTEETTTEQHVAELLSIVRERWQFNMLDRSGKGLAPNGNRILIRADPYGNNDNKPDRSCYTIFRNAGFLIHPAAYNSDGDKPGRIPKNEGIEVVNTLLCNAQQVSRLFVAKNEHGAPVAPKLVKSIESAERDHNGKAETQRKDGNDLSHWTAALRYALWAVERPRLNLSRAVPA